jgi:hypothetical protein
MNSKSMETASREAALFVQTATNVFLNACKNLHFVDGMETNIICAAVVEAAAMYSVVVLSATYQVTEAEIREAADNFASRMRIFAEAKRARIGGLN